ncbi:B12-binding domain-containing radical SAM protein [Cryptosporangium sp. NPDC051539]|uniref:B12-binding domain-containing radical SAM protein n=1 Tax=Cryptosporangium sp. NPDC051539 TaxID=3363962 RepID=UPI00379BDCBC
MRVLLILPALTEATSPAFRPIKYSLFPPLGLATLAAYLPDDDEVRIVDEHVERFRPEDSDLPDLVVIQVYVTSARRSYELADWFRERGVFVALGGLHVTSLPDEAAAHADAIFLGPGEDTWPAFLADLRPSGLRPSGMRPAGPRPAGPRPAGPRPAGPRPAGPRPAGLRPAGLRPADLRPAGLRRRSSAIRYTSTSRTLERLPPIRRDLIRRERYLVPNSIVVSRGCPHHCDFCYKDAFFDGGKSFYVQRVDDALAEIDRLPGRHLYFLDDHLFGNRRFAQELFAGMRGQGRVWQAAGTVDSVLAPDLLESAVDAGLRSLFVGFETINAANLPGQRKRQNVGRSYEDVVRRLHDCGVMVNASFVFGMDEDGPDVFDRTVAWAIEQGIETATFHIMTPYPGTGLFTRIDAEDRLVHRDWERYDTRHVVYRPRGMTAGQLEAGYWRAYRDFYRWGALWRSAATKDALGDRLRHLAYAGGWKKFEPVWDALIRTRQVLHALPLLETALSSFGTR